MSRFPSCAMNTKTAKLGAIRSVLTLDVARHFFTLTYTALCDFNLRSFVLSWDFSVV